MIKTEYESKEEDGFVKLANSRDFSINQYTNDTQDQLTGSKDTLNQTLYLNRSPKVK
jgi:hypothetical protein